MPLTRAMRLVPALVPAVVLAIVVALLPFRVPPSSAATAAAITVASALQRQDGSVATVEGYVVGQPTATSTVVRSNFPSDYALALADVSGETRTSAMVYVQIPSAFRASYGLRSNPSRLGPADRP